MLRRRTFLYALCIVLVSSGPKLAMAVVIHVDVDATGLADGSSWPNAFLDLQDALGVAQTGDEVWVAEGTYVPTPDTDRAATFSLRNGIAIYGGFVGTEVSRDQREWQSNQCVLSGEIGVSGSLFPAEWSRLEDPTLPRSEVHRVLKETGEYLAKELSGPEPQKDLYDNSAHVVTGSGTDSTAVLDGFTITGGWNDLPGGAGIWIVDGSPTLRNLRVLSNITAASGAGAMLTDGSSPTLSGVEFAQNWGGYTGGAMHVDETSAPHLDGVLFSRNSSSVVGAGLYSRGAPRLEGVRFEENFSTDGGGAMSCSGSPLLTNVSFVGNRVDLGSGGALHVFDGEPILMNVLFADNACPGTTGGSGAALGGGAIYNEGSGTLLNVTAYGNRSLFGSGIYNTGVLTITNSVFWGNLFPDSPIEEGLVEMLNYQGQVQIRHSLVRGSGGSGPDWDGSLGGDEGGNVDADPLFVDSALGDLRLTPSSPAVNAGLTSALPVNSLTDLEGNPRVIGGAVDMGAYELQDPGCEVFPVVMGATWDTVSLQEILDSEYGVGTIDVATEYEGYQCGDAVEPYWIDTNIDAWLVKEIAGFRDQNVFGWHVERFSSPVIDGTDDGIIFEGSGEEGQVAAVTLPAGETRFGFYLNPNGTGDTANAPEPEFLFTNRRYNDAGPDGAGDERLPEGGDPQCLIFNITDLRNGTPTYVLAWEDIDYGSPISETWTSSSTDNDFNDLVVEIQAMSPVPAMVANLAARRVSEGVRLTWSIEDSYDIERLELVRRIEARPERVIAAWTHAEVAGEWIDTEALGSEPARYRLDGYVRGTRVSSREVGVAGAAPTPTRLLRAVPNPFNPSTQIRFELGVTGEIALSIYDLSGRRVRTLIEGPLGAGSHAITWNGRDDSDRPVASGVYLYQLKVGDHAETKRMVLLR